MGIAKTNVNRIGDYLNHYRCSDMIYSSNSERLWTSHKDFNWQ